MPAAPLPVRTHRAFGVDDVTFQDLIARRLQQAPWLVLSAAAHGLLLLLLWVLLPPATKTAPVARVGVAMDDPPAEASPPPPPPPPVTRPEPDPQVVVTTDQSLPEDEPEAFDQLPSDSSAKESSFPHDQWNAALGIAGGAGGPYGARGRGPGGRGGRPTAPYVQEGLEWLAAHQDVDGRWDTDRFMKHDDPRFAICDGPGNAVHDVGVTGLALLAFLGENNTLRSGPYRDVVKRGALWLRSQQQANGLFGSNASHDFVYDHAIAAYAMCEAFGLSQSKLLRDTAQKGLDYLEAHRNPYGVWRYQPRDGDNDLSVTGWAVMACKSGKYFGLAVSDNALKNAAVFFDQVSDPSGRHGYTRSGEPSSRKPGDHATRFPPDKGEALTAVGLFCRCFLGQNPADEPVMKAAAQRLADAPPRWNQDDGSIDHYYWYYATYALFQIGGPAWKSWQKQLEKVVGEHQHRLAAEPNLKGSWDPVGAWGDDGGRVYSTAILTLAMQANYRYTRLIR